MRALINGLNRTFSYGRKEEFVWFEDHIQWCWITKGFPQIALDSVLRRQIQLLEELGRYRDAAGSPNALKGVILGVVGAHGEVVVVRIAVTVVVFLEKVGRVAVGGAILVLRHFGRDEAIGRAATCWQERSFG